MDEIKYIIYARKSTEDKSRQIQSIDDQVKVLKDIAINFNLNVVEILTESKSAKAPNNRPQFTKMMGLIESGKVNSILC
jgi:DNA invertase Pin-like site-specific DNA recombinase